MFLVIDMKQNTLRNNRIMHQYHELFKVMADPEVDSRRPIALLAGG
ncbi:hypothetical protein HYS47_00125 [Candidatus Woesearchaeota archaeon]|nr:hypothetical protein [Candidatus Woesearchaeota archaeon]